MYNHVCIHTNIYTTYMRTQQLAVASLYVYMNT